MAFDGSGNFTRPVSPYVFDTDISETDMNAEMDGIATGLSNAICRDGQSTTTSVIPFDAGLSTNTISENTSGSGVTVDGVLLKDGGATLKASVTQIQDPTDATKQLKFDASGITTATTRTLAVPDASGTIALTSDIDFTFFRGYLSGLTLANNVSDSNNDIDISVGVAQSSDNGYQLSLGSSLTKRLDASWAAGTNQGGLDTGSKANSTWYHVWLIARSDTGVVDALFSTSSSSPTMPSNYDFKRRIGSVVTSSSGNILAFKQNGDTFYLTTSVTDVNTTVGTSASLKVLTVPLGVKVVPLYRAQSTNTSSSHTLAISSPDETDQSVASGYFDAVAVVNTTSNVVWRPLHTDTLSQLRFKASAASTAIILQTYGWVDRRGRDD